MQFSIITLATLLTFNCRTLLRIAAAGNAIGLYNLKNELDNENDRKAVQAAMAVIQDRMMHGMYDSMEQMESDLEFEIELQKRLHRDQ